MNTKHKTCFRNSPNDLEGPALLTSMVLRVQQLCLLAALLNWKIAIHMACMCAFITISIILISMSVLWYGDGAGNTADENSSVFSLIRMC